MQIAFSVEAVEAYLLLPTSKIVSLHTIYFALDTVLDTLDTRMSQ